MIRRALRRGTRWLVGEASDNRVRFFDVVDAAVAANLSLSADCGRSFDVSTNLEKVVLGYWWRAGIDVIDLPSGRIQRIAGPARTSRVFLRPDGSEIAMQTEKGTWVVSQDGHERLRLVHADDLAGSSFSPRTRELFVPTRRKGLIARVLFEGGLQVVHHELPVPAQISWLRHSPTDPRILALGSNKRLYCFEETTLESRWTTDLQRLVRPDHSYVFSCSGDGELVGVTVTERRGCRTVVVESATGVVRGTLNGRGCAGEPFKGKEVLLDEGALLNLETGSVEVLPIVGWAA